MAMTPAQMIEAVTRNLQKNTGRDASGWAALLEKHGPEDEKERYQWLRQEHGLGHVAARIVSGQLKPYEAPEKLVDAQYSGKRAALRPLYDALVKAARRLGRDVSPLPCKTYVPLHRKHTFAVIKPGPDRVDLGLVLPGATAAGRLKRASTLGSDRITHKIEVRTMKDIDAELRRWLKTAYERSAR